MRPPRSLMNSRRPTAVAPVLPTERIAHFNYGRRLLRCGISVRPGGSQRRVRFMMPPDDPPWVNSVLSGCPMLTSRPTFANLLSEGASARSGSECLQRGLPLLSGTAYRETESEQPAHIIGIKI